MTRRVIIVFCLISCLATIILYKPRPNCLPYIEFEPESKIQKLSDESLNKWIGVTNSQSGSVIIKEVKQDKLLSVSSQSMSDEIDDCGNQINLALMPWEPGSVIKPLMFQAKVDLSQNKVDLGSIFKSRENIVIDNKVITNYKDFSDSEYTLEEISRESINTGAIAVYESFSDNKAARKTMWHKYMTDIYKLEDISNYLVTNPKKGKIPEPNIRKESNYRYALSSIGLGMTITPLQLVNSYEIALGYGDDSLIRKESVNFIRELLYKNLKNNKIDKFEEERVMYGGKTGTSSIIGPDGKYTNLETGSFIGYVEFDNKTYIIFTQLVKPNGEVAGEEAYKFWADISENIIKTK